MSQRPARSRRPAAALLAAVASVLGAACRTSSPAEQRAARTTGDVVIAVAWPWAAHPEIRFGQGLDMAAAEVNASGGIGGRRLRLSRVDDRESVDSGRLVAQRLGNDPEVAAVIGHLQSYVTVPAAAAYDEAGLVLVSPTASDPELTSHAYTRVFRATFTNRTVGRHMAEYAAAHGYRRVAIYYTRDDYGRGLSNAFEERANELGVTTAARQSYDPGGQSTKQTFLSTFEAWHDVDFDALFVAGEVPSAGTLIAQARKAGIAVPVIGVDAMSSPELMSVGGRDVEGTVVPTVFHVSEPRTEVRRFTAAFVRRYATEPDAGSALGYDAVWLLARAMRQAHSSDPAAVARVLHALKGIPGVTGAFSFDSTGDLEDRPLVKTVVQNGQFVYLPDTRQLVAARP
ncbi:branched-chain amino acid ABC transporter substrate-binding protein [Gemmatimonadetes bacterium T265]|nr:branched-chain amino acid ABC transporter substrate-binding protein [Gemmatimonadetes bacterium T265]